MSDHSHSRYPRRSSSSAASLSPVKRYANVMASRPDLGGYGDVDVIEDSPPARITPASRMALSALVNSPPAAPGSLPAAEPATGGAYRSPSPAYQPPSRYDARDRYHPQHHSGHHDALIEPRSAHAAPLSATSSTSAAYAYNGAVRGGDERVGPSSRSRYAPVHETYDYDEPSPRHSIAPRAASYEYAESSSSRRRGSGSHAVHHHQQPQPQPQQHPIHRGGGAGVPPDGGRSYLPSPFTTAPLVHPAERSAHLERTYSNKSYGSSAAAYDDYDRNLNHHDVREMQQQDRRRAYSSRSPSKPTSPVKPTMKMTPQVPPEPARYHYVDDGYAQHARRRTYASQREEDVDDVDDDEDIAGEDQRPVASHTTELQPLKVFRLSDSLVGTDAIWENARKRYQNKREQEVKEIESLSPSRLTAAKRKLKKAGGGGVRDDEQDASRGSSAVPEGGAAGGKAKRRGWPADHPRRVAIREAKEARIAAGLEPVKAPKRKYKRKAAAIDDELLGLAEGADESVAGPSSPPPHMGSDMPDGGQSVVNDDDDDDHEPLDLSPDAIVQPCGLTRTELMRRIDANQMKGLTETDVKAVQDEMWARTKNPEFALTRKDGTQRRKPGPAKGWKKLRGEAKGSSVRGDDSEADVSVAGDTVNGEAEAEIAALLGDDGDDMAAGPSTLPAATTKTKRGKGKKRKTEDVDVASLIADTDEKPNMDLGTDGLDAAGMPLPAPAKPPKKPKHKEPGVGKGRWTRPTKAEKEQREAAKREADAATAPADEAGPGSLASEDPELLLAAGIDPSAPVNAESAADGAGAVPPPRESHYVPNSEDPRGVSEHEAGVRLSVVEDLQKQVWQAIVRDVPRIYRVYQGYDTTARQDALRKAQAAVRNGFLQRSSKPTYKSAAKINKDAGSRARKVMKEMLVYWRKNEKDELAARKKAEKEALEKAKAEEEARESKRQARKLNFLLTQTELYSHFIGKKIKTAEAEKGDGADTADAAIDASARSAHDDLAIDDNGEALPDIDYDDDDEENLRRHAARGAQAAMQAAKDKAAAFDRGRSGADAMQTGDIDLDGDELNFQNPSLGENSIVVTQPKMLMAQLKEYQLKGLTWLANLYEQGINGILADEMGLGKTIQSISLLAYLAEVQNLWGPFLVIAPASTLHNWQQELARFVPRLKALPYWGSPKDRETLRRIWSRKNMTFNEDSPFHILVTSYQIAVLDEKYFQNVKWQYMVLDEAQAIKSSSSNRWKSLLSLPCRNRLLLTGTPIQNSMHELWALLHFIMPSLFDSHEEFSEWFSRDIENAAGGGGGQLKPEQLRRLHMILKPFMLRRVKKHVQKELGDKIEIDVLVDLSHRQRTIYKALRQRVSISDLIAQANNIHDSSGAKNLMNLVMQFRKVCNHPDLFERADVVSPFVFGTFSHSGNLAREGDTLYCPDSTKNAIQVQLPRLVWDEKLDRPAEDSPAGSENHVLRNLCSIWRTDWVGEALKEDQGRFGFLRVMGMGAQEGVKRAREHPLVQLLHSAENAHRQVERGEFESDGEFAASSGFTLKPVGPKIPSARTSDETPLRDITSTAWNTSFLSRRDARFATDLSVAPFIRPVVSARSFLNAQERLAEDPLVRTALYGATPSEKDDLPSVARMSDLVPGVPPEGLIAASPAYEAPIPSLRIPPTKRLIVDSAKLARLDELLRELKDGGHRVLLYFQMTRMMDLVEEYLIYRQYKYLRLDGASPIGERRDMVTSWQTNPDIFVFCLSTRAGGLGINLTAADTVIFYDHDWNPSNDAQAMDRAHRVGQTKQVTVYRLIARGTIEERIVKLARAKKDVQDIVVGTKSLTDVAKPAEIASLFMDDEELAESVAKRKQAEAHGYVVTAAPQRSRSAFGDGLGGGQDEDEDDFFSLAKQPANNEDEDFGDETKPNGGTAVNGASGAAANGGGQAKKKKPSGGSKRKAPPASGDAGENGGDGAAAAATPTKQPKKKKVKIAVGPDGLPI